MSWVTCSHIKHNFILFSGIRKTKCRYVWHTCSTSKHGHSEAQQQAWRGWDSDVWAFQRLASELWRTQRWGTCCTTSQFHASIIHVIFSMSHEYNFPNNTHAHTLLLTFNFSLSQLHHFMIWFTLSVRCTAVTPCLCLPAQDCVVSLQRNTKLC